LLNRRQALQGFGALALGAATQPAWPAAPLDLGNRQDLLTALAKMRGATDERLTIGYVVGMRYAVPEHVPIPMMGILAATFSQYRRLSAETFEARSIEVAFFTDVETGNLLERWKNPVTGQVVEVPQTRMGPSLITLTADGLRVPKPSGEAAGMELRHRFLPPVVVGDDVWITEDIRADHRPGAAPPFVYNELSTYHARKSALDDPALAAVPVTVDYQSLITYRPWMGFGTTPGHTIARGAGARVARIEELPAVYLELARRHHPDVIRDARGVLAAAA
jgi:hypothetical protein